MCVSDCVHDCIPRGRKENVCCILQNDQNMALRQAGKHSNFDDDCRVWDSSKGRTTVLLYMKTSISEYKRLLLRTGYTVTST